MLAVPKRIQDSVHVRKRDRQNIESELEHQIVLYYHDEKLLDTSTNPSPAFVTTTHLGRNLKIPSNPGILPPFSNLPPPPAVSDACSEYSQAILPLNGGPGSSLRPQRHLHLEPPVPRPAPQEESSDALRRYLVPVLVRPVLPIAIERTDPVVVNRLVEVYPAPSCVCSADTDHGS